MLHVSYGLFDDVAHARSAVDAIEASHIGQRCHVVLETDRLDQGRLGLAETAVGEALREGIAAGSVLGAIAGGVVGGPIAIVPTAFLGAVYGGVGGALAGAGGPERHLRRFAKQLTKGKALVVVEAPSLLARDEVDDVMRANGAEVEHKAAL